MQSSAWINGQRQQVGPPSRSSQAAAQFIHNTMRNQQAGTADISWQYETANTEVPPPQNLNLNHPNGAYSHMQPSHWQNSAAPRQAASSQRTAQEKNYLLKQLLRDIQPSSTVTVQNGNTNMVTVHHQPNLPAQWNQPAGEQSMRTHDGNVVSNHQYYVDKNMFGILNGQSTQPISTYATTATSRPGEQVTYTGTLVPAADRQSAPNNPRQNVPQHHFFPPSCNRAVSQSFRNNSITTNSSANGQNLLVSSTSMKTQRYSTHNNWGEVTSSINSSSHYMQHEPSPFLSKTKEAPLNPAVDTQLEMRQKISMIEHYLREPSTAGSDGRSPLFSHSPYGQQQFGNEVRMMASNQNMQPVTSTVPASQALPLNSGQYLPVTSTQHSVNVPPQQRSVPNIFHVTASQDGGRIRRKTFVVNKNTVGSLSDASQLSEGILPQRIETQSSVANYHEMRLPAKSSDSSIHSSPGRTRAVAVVQPLSQESYQVVSKKTGPHIISQSHGGTTTDESLSNPDKLSISPNGKKIGPGVAPHLYRENQMRSSKSPITPSAASTDGPSMSSANSARTQDLSQKQLCADDTGSELAVDMQVDQRVASTVQQSVTCSLIIESCDGDESETPTDPKEVLELSAIPTHPWTLFMLNKLVQGGPKPQMKVNDVAMFSPLNKLIHMFWDGDVKNMIRVKRNPGWYREYLTEVEKFCSKHDTPDSVILSEVKASFRKHLESYCVLKDKEVYSELPYKSSWRNINEQLDDIDKDLGFPWSLRRHLYTVESNNQSDQVDGDDDIPAEIVLEMLEKMSSTELEPAVLSTEKHDSTVKATSAQTASPDTGESEDSSDLYSFEINVLSPDKAKIVFDQVQSTRGMDTQPESVTDSYATIELPKMIDITSMSDANQENMQFCPIEELCCIERLKETICGSNSAFKCQCKQDKQSLDDVTEKTLVKEDVAEQKKERSDSKFHRATEGGNQAKGEENDKNRVMSLGWPELHTELYHIIDLTDDDNKPHSYSDEEPQNVTQRSTSQIPDSENYFAINNDSEPEVDCAQDLLPFTGNSQSCTLVSSEEDTENLYFGKCEVSNQMSDLKENSDQLISTNVVESELESEEDQTDSSAAWSYEQESVERKRKSSHDGFFSDFKKSKKFRNADSQQVLEGASTYEKVVDDDEPSASNVQTVELVLFGSTPQDKSALTGGTKSHVPSLRPPKVLTVNLSPKKRKLKKNILSWEYSVKHLYKKWKIRFSPNEHGSKLKSKKSSGKSLKRVRSASTEELPVSSDMRMLDGKTKPCLTLKRRWSLSNELTCGEEKTEKHTVTLDQPADQEAEMPQQNIDALKFSVLPNSFSFKDGSNETKETNDPVSGVPDLVEVKDESHNKNVLKAKGTWYSIPEKKCFSPPAPKTSSLFLAFQKKYKEMTQTTVNE